MRDVFAHLMNEVCYDVEMMRSLNKKSTSTDDAAGLDIKANGLWE